MYNSFLIFSYVHEVDYRQAKWSTFGGNFSALIDRRLGWTSRREAVTIVMRKAVLDM